MLTMRGTGWRMLPLRANGQPALAAYAPDGGTLRVHTLQVLSVGSAGVERNVVFQDRDVFAAFGLPPVLEPPVLEPPVVRPPA